MTKPLKRESKKKDLEGYYNIRKEGWSLLLHASLAFDSAMTILSAAFLGFVFSATKDQLIVGSAMQGKAYLILILVMLVICVFVSLISLWFDQRYGAYLMFRADKLYLYEDPSYVNKSHWSYFAALISKVISSVLFFFAIILFSIFFVVNIDNSSIESGSTSKQQANSQVKEAV